MLKQTAALLSLACGMILLGTHPVQGQVCLVDVAKVFESHSGFNSSLENLKQQAEEYKFSLQQRGDALRIESEQLNSFKPGTPEYSSLESKLAQAAANLEVERRNKTREFVELEAKLHFETYVQVTKAISAYCDQRGYRVALRFSDLQVDASNPQSIMQRVNDYVVFYQPRIDITKDIINSLSGSAPRVSESQSGTQNK